jgi:hypothetical protein
VQDPRLERPEQNGPLAICAVRQGMSSGHRDTDKGAQVGMARLDLAEPSRGGGDYTGTGTPGIRDHHRALGVPHQGPGVATEVSTAPPASEVLSGDILHLVMAFCPFVEDVSNLGRVNNSMSRSVDAVGINDPALSHFGVVGSYIDRLYNEVGDRHLTCERRHLHSGGVMTWMIIVNDVVYALRGSSIYAMDRGGHLQHVIHIPVSPDAFHVHQDRLYLMTGSEVWLARLQLSAGGGSSHHYVLVRRAQYGHTLKAMVLCKEGSTMYVCHSDQLRPNGYNITTYLVQPDGLLRRGASFRVDPASGGESCSLRPGTQATATQHMSYDEIDNRLLVFDSASSRVLVISTAGKTLFSLTTPEETKFGYLSQVVRAWTEYIVSNSATGKIHRYTIKGAYTGDFPSHGPKQFPYCTGPDPETHFGAITAGPGRLYVSEDMGEALISSYE